MLRYINVDKIKADGINLRMNNISEFKQINLSIC